MICLRHLSHSYSKPNGQRKLALKEINLSIPLGSFTAVIGPNNSGKSTLAKILSGLITPSSGQFLFEDVEISQWNPNSLRKSIGLIFSNPEDQIVFPTVEEDLAFGLENFCFDPGQIEKRVLETSCIKNTSFRKTSKKELYGYEHYLIRFFYKIGFRLVPVCILNVFYKLYECLKLKQMPPWYFRTYRMNLSDEQRQHLPK